MGYSREQVMKEGKTVATDAGGAEPTQVKRTATLVFRERPQSDDVAMTVPTRRQLRRGTGSL